MNKLSIRTICHRCNKVIAYTESCTQAYQARDNPDQFCECFQHNEKIALAAMSWNPAFPDKKEIPIKYAQTCRTAMSLARKKHLEPIDCLPEACVLNGVDESELINKLETLEWVDQN
jgi:hypothetical protein